MPLSIKINSVHFKGTYFDHTTPIISTIKTQELFFMFSIYAKYYPVVKSVSFLGNVKTEKMRASCKLLSTALVFSAFHIYGFV